MSATSKIAATSTSRSNPSEIESSIASALYDLETSVSDLKAALRPLQFVSAREVSGPEFGIGRAADHVSSWRSHADFELLSFAD